MPPTLPAGSRNTEPFNNRGTCRPSCATRVSTWSVKTPFSIVSCMPSVARSGSAK